MRYINLFPWIKYLQRSSHLPLLYLLKPPSSFLFSISFFSCQMSWCQPKDLFTLEFNLICFKYSFIMKPCYSSRPIISFDIPLRISVVPSLLKSAFWPFLNRFRVLSGLFVTTLTSFLLNFWAVLKSFLAFIHFFEFFRL